MKLKRLLWVAALAVAVPALAEEAKFGYVNQAEVAQLMPEFKDAQRQIEDMQLLYTQEGKKLQDEFQTKYDAFQQEASKLDPVVAQQRQSELEKMYENIQTFGEAAQQNLQKKQAELMIPIGEKLKKALKEVGADKKLAFIFNVEEGGDVLYYNPALSVDVTAALKQKLGIK